MASGALWRNAGLDPSVNFVPIKSKQLKLKQAKKGKLSQVVKNKSSIFLILSHITKDAQAFFRVSPLMTLRMRVRGCFANSELVMTSISQRL